MNIPAGTTVFDNLNRVTQFSDVEGFSKRISELPPVRTTRLWFDSSPGELAEGVKPSQEELSEFSDYRAVIGNMDSKGRTVVSKDYALVPNPEAALYVLEAVKNLNLDVMGRITESRRGFMDLSILIKNPDYQLGANVGAGEGDLLALGVRALNSYGIPYQSLEAGFLGGVYICGNLNVWGKWLGSIGIHHRGNPVQEFEAYLTEIPKQADFIREAIETAAQNTVTIDVGRRILPCIPGRKKVIDDVERQLLDVGVVQSNGLEVSDWQVAQSLTHAATHVASRSAGAQLQVLAQGVLLEGTDAIFPEIVEATTNGNVTREQVNGTTVTRRQGQAPRDARFAGVNQD